MHNLKTSSSSPPPAKSGNLIHMTTGNPPSQPHNNEKKRRMTSFCCQLQNEDYLTIAVLELYKLRIIDSAGFFYDLIQTVVKRLT